MQNIMLFMTNKEMYAIISKSKMSVSNLFSILARYDNTDKVLLTAEIINDNWN